MGKVSKKCKSTAEGSSGSPHISGTHPHECLSAQAFPGLMSQGVSLLPTRLWHVVSPFSTLFFLVSFAVVMSANFR
jgi:hypothetical protein